MCSSDLRTSLGLSERAIADDLEDATSLRVERLFGYFAVGDEATLDRELDALESRADLGRLRAHVDLARGAQWLCDSARGDEGRDRVREALRSRGDLSFSPADAPYAEALAETSPRRSLALMREAARLDPLHFPARAGLASSLLAVGELTEARQQAEMLQALAPDATLPDLLQALADLVAGDRPAMHRRLDKLARRCGPDGQADVAELRAYLDSFGELLGLLNGVDAHNGLNTLDHMKLAWRLSRAGPKGTSAVRRFGFPVPSVGLMFASFRAIADANVKLPTMKPEPAFRFLSKLIADHPDALLPAMAAANRLGLSPAVVDRGEPAECRALFVEIGRLAEMATRAPTLIPMSPIRYQSRILCAIADVSLLKMTPKPDPRHWERLRDDLRPMIVEGRKWPKSREEGLDILLKMVVVPMTESQARDWSPDALHRSEGYLARRRELGRFARRLAEDWLEDEPQSDLARHWVGEFSLPVEGTGLVTRTEKR